MTVQATPDAIKNLLENAGITQTDIAKELGISLSYVNDVVQGKRRGRKVRLFIAQKLDRPVAHLWPDESRMTHIPPCAKKSSAHFTPPAVPVQGAVSMPGKVCRFADAGKTECFLAPGVINLSSCNAQAACKAFFDAGGEEALAALFAEIDFFGGLTADIMDLVKDEHLSWGAEEFMNKLRERLEAVHKRHRDMSLSLRGDGGVVDVVDPFIALITVLFGKSPEAEGLVECAVASNIG